MTIQNCLWLAFVLNCLVGLYITAGWFVKMLVTGQWWDKDRAFIVNVIAGLLALTITLLAVPLGFPIWLMITVREKVGLLFSKGSRWPDRIVVALFTALSTTLVVIVPWSHLTWVQAVFCFIGMFFWLLLIDLLPIPVFKQRKPKANSQKIIQ